MGGLRVLVDTVIVQTVAISCHGNKSWHGPVFVQCLISFESKFARHCGGGLLFYSSNGRETWSSLAFRRKGRQVQDRA